MRPIFDRSDIATWIVCAVAICTIPAIALGFAQGSMTILLAIVLTGVSLVLGIISLPFFWLAILAAPVAILNGFGIDHHNCCTLSGGNDESIGIAVLVAPLTFLGIVIAVQWLLRMRPKPRWTFALSIPLYLGWSFMMFQLDAYASAQFCPPICAAGG
jgi:hypothetical protein